MAPLGWQLSEHAKTRRSASLYVLPRTTTRCCGAWRQIVDERAGWLRLVTGITGGLTLGGNMTSAGTIILSTLAF